MLESILCEHLACNNHNVMRSSVERRNIVYIEQQQYTRLDGVSHRNTYRKDGQMIRDRLLVHTISTL